MVNEKDIPEQFSIKVSATNRALLARILNRTSIPLEFSHDTIEHLFNKGLEFYYDEKFEKGVE